jgi:hypothetical protein
MATRYDEELGDWVGIMDADQFYAECERSNAKFFRELITAWTDQAGCMLQWEIGGVSLCGYIAGKRFSVCGLAPQSEIAGTKDHIKLPRATDIHYISKDRAEQREKEICAAAGFQPQVRDARLDIVQPGKLSRANQAALIRAILDVR